MTTNRARISSLIFGAGATASGVRELARLTGRSPSTVSRWRKTPDHIPLGDLQIILKARGADIETMVRILKG